MRTAFIKSQTAPAVSGLSIGAGTVAHMGCEAVALFNTLTYFGGAPDFEALLSELEEEALLWRNGKWGMSPSKMKKYLKTRGFSASYVSSGKLLKLTPPELSLRHEAIIVTCFNHDFFHNGVHSFGLYPETSENAAGYFWSSPNGYVSGGKTVSEVLSGRKLFRAMLVSDPTHYPVHSL